MKFKQTARPDFIGFGNGIPARVVVLLWVKNEGGIEW